MRVRYGRVGGSGRLRVEEPADAADAAAHPTMLIGRKERAGHREAGGAAGLSAEGPFALPARWRALVLSRRGGGVPAELSWPGRADAAAGDVLVAARGASIAETLESEGNDPGLLRAARAPVRLGGLDALTASELLAELEGLTSF